MSRPHLLGGPEYALGASCFLSESCERLLYSDYLVPWIWRSIMIQKLDCGCSVDDAFYLTTHEKDGHYPIGTSPGSFGKKCDKFKPCGCVIKTLNDADR